MIELDSSMSVIDRKGRLKGGLMLSNAMMSVGDDGGDATMDDGEHTIAAAKVKGMCVSV